MYILNIDILNISKINNVINTINKIYLKYD